MLKELVAPYFDPNWHFHPEYQLFFVLEGRGTRFIGDNIKTFKENDMVLMGPDLPHLWRSNNEYFEKTGELQTRGIVIYFKEDFLGNTIQQKEEMKDILHLLQNSKRGLEITGPTNARVSNMMLALTRLKGVDSLIQLLRILQTLALSHDCHPIATAGYVNLNKESEKDRMNRVYEHVINNFDKKISLEEVAAIANMSLSSFSRYFKSRVNKSFSDFLSEIRIGHACKLLNDEDLNISQVCYESGFNTLSNFNKQFRDITGKTPLQYKKECLLLQQPFD
ncbi:AraC family transcriptional regulator [Pontibacter qinzhouensis]|uniref:AraC family transcriptional regulator n=2 Tax=Pontibacter qinzhouensis TaxID=2603253 RepID=A0A5C8JJV1_9BACT|nr:AraC family transcriptional regulator [Pontibacter qinzhouensis]